MTDNIALYIKLCKVYSDFVKNNPEGYERLCEERKKLLDAMSLEELNSMEGIIRPRIWSLVIKPRIKERMSIPSDVLAEYIDKAFTNIKKVLQGFMSTEMAVDKFCQFVQQYTTDSSKLKRLMQEIIEFTLSYKVFELATIKTDNDSLKKENVALRRKLAFFTESEQVNQKRDLDRASFDLNVFLQGKDTNSYKMVGTPKVAIFISYKKRTCTTTEISRERNNNLFKKNTRGISF